MKSLILMYAELRCPQDLNVGCSLLVPTVCKSPLQGSEKDKEVRTVKAVLNAWRRTGEQNQAWAAQKPPVK